MKNVLLAATVVGAAAAGVILYLTNNRSRTQYALEGAADTAEDAGQVASKHLRKTKRKMNNIMKEME